MTSVTGEGAMNVEQSARIRGGSTLDRLDNSDSVDRRRGDS